MVVSNLGVRNALNVYLFEIRENRKLRSNSHTRQIENGIAHDTPAPPRIDCHYLITAWSPATVTPAIEPTLDEHTLLYEVTAALMDQQSLVPAKHLCAKAPSVRLPRLDRGCRTSCDSVTCRGLSQICRILGNDGKYSPLGDQRSTVATIPVALHKEVAGPLVTTRVMDYRQSGKPETSEMWIRIGGTVLDASDVTKLARR